MNDLVMFSVSLSQNGSCVPITVPASAYYALGEKTEITPQEALSVGIDISQVVEEKTGEHLFSSADILKIREEMADSSEEMVQLPILTSVAEKIRSEAVGLISPVTFLEPLPATENASDIAVVDQNTIFKEQLQPPRIYIPTTEKKEDFFKKTEEEKELAVTIENYLCAQFEFRIQGEQLYLFDPRAGYYKKITDSQIDHIVNAIFGERIKNDGKSFVYREVREFLKRESKLLVKDSQVLSTKIWVFQNMLVNAFTEETFPNDGGFFVRSALQSDYEKYATCPDFDLYLNSIAGGDPQLVQLLWEVVAYLLSRETKAKKIFFLVGKKDSGKSLFANILTGIVGEDAVSFLSANDFGKQFGLSELAGKHLNVCMDLPDVPISLESVGKIKAITGGDMIRSDVKFKNSVRFRVTARLLFGANAMVRTAYPDQAFAERCIFVPFRYGVPREKQDYQLCEKLLKERAGICRKAMMVYADLAERGFNFTTVAMDEDLMVKVIDWEKVIDTFLEQRCELTKKETDRISSEMLFNAFSTFCCEKGLSGLSREAFSRLLRKKTEGKVEKKKIRIGNETVNGFVGLRFKEGKKDDE